MYYLIIAQTNLTKPQAERVRHKLLGGFISVSGQGFGLIFGKSCLRPPKKYLSTKKSGVLFDTLDASKRISAVKIFFYCIEQQNFYQKGFYFFIFCEKIILKKNLNDVNASNINSECHLCSEKYVLTRKNQLFFPIIVINRKFHN